MKFRKESDTMGTVEVPQKALWGAQTQRAIGNGIAMGRLPARLWLALIGIKRAAALTNGDLELIDATLSAEIAAAADRLLHTGDTSYFPLTRYMTGSGTSANMNVNEVMANIVNERIGHGRGSKTPAHPNDHVNKCQSSNDVFPTAIHIGVLAALEEELFPASDLLTHALTERAKTFSTIIKLGRTHLMDALPVYLGSEFGAYATQLRNGTRRLQEISDALLELPIGGTAVGTGVNAHPDFAIGVISRLSQRHCRDYVPAPNRFEAMGSLDRCVAVSGALRSLAVSMIKMANDIRWMASGPGGGLGEIVLPAVQPGSSIMPGKVNPVIPEAVIQAMTQVMGLDSAIAMAGTGGVLELNLMMPLLGSNLIEAVELTAGAMTLFAEKCIQGIEADRARCARNLEQSMALVTPLAVKIGYDKAAEVAKKAHDEAITLREAALALGVAQPEELDKLLDPSTMV